MGTNVWHGSGHLGADPDLRHTQSGTPVVSLRMAMTRKWTSKVDGNDTPREETTWVNVSAWGKTAEVANQYLSKGSWVEIVGRLRNTEWEGKDGVKRYGMEVVCTQLELGPKQGGSRAPHPADQGKGGPGDDYIPAPGDDDIPF